MACEYCKDWPKPVCFKRSSRHTAMVTVLGPTSDLCVGFGDIVTDTPLMIFYQKINYCPMCGCDLRKAE